VANYEKNPLFIYVSLPKQKKAAHLKQTAKGSLLDFYIQLERKLDIKTPKICSFILYYYFCRRSSMQLFVPPQQPSSALEAEQSQPQPQPPDPFPNHFLAK